MNDQIEFEKPKMIIASKRVLFCAQCKIHTPHWITMKGTYMCGFCGTEHAAV